MLSNPFDRKTILAFVFFNLILSVLFTLLLTAPSYLFLNDHILGFPHDGFEYIWKMWWYRLTLSDPSLEFSNTLYTNFPIQGNNFSVSAIPFLNWIAFPFYALLGGLKTYNLMLLSGFILGWLGAASLGYYFSQDFLASSLGGGFFVFNANNVAHAMGGHIAQTFVFLMPLAVIALFISYKKQKLWLSVGAGILFGLLALIELKLTALYVLPFLGFFFFYHGFFEKAYRSKYFWQMLLIVFGTTVAIIFPFYKPLLVSGVSGDLSYYDQPGVIRHSADLLGFITPSPEHPIYRNIPGISQLSTSLAQWGWHENVFYLGWVALFLVFIAFRERLQIAGGKFWAFVFGSAFILSLGPSLKIANFVTGIPLPFALLAKLPFYQWSRTPGRFITLMILAMAVLIPLGFSQILKQVKTGRNRLLVTLLVLSLMLFDAMYIWPWVVSPVQVPAVVTELSLEENTLAVMDYPVWDYRCMRQAQYFATLHQHPMATGIVQRRDPAVEPLLENYESWLFESSPTSLSQLAEQGFGYIFIHKNCASDENIPDIQPQLQALLGTPYFEDDILTVFVLPMD